MSPRTRHLLLTTTALLALGPQPGAAGPDGPVVVGGKATVTGAGTGAVGVFQGSDRAIINWNTFNIGKGDSATFAQPSSSSVILNRVTGGLGPSEIFGTLTANGRVFLINRDGILFGPSATIDTAGFLATTNNIKNKDFMAGRFYFNHPGRPDASIVNLGHITAAQGGFAALVAPGVRNSGTITATLGTVSLASGNMFTLDLYGDKLIQLSVNDKIAGEVRDVATGQTLKSLVTNEGKITANGGRVELTAAAARAVVDSVINNTGVLEANTIGTKNGMIVLGAATEATKPPGAPTQTVKVSGKLSAAGKKPGTTGGTIVVTGENIEVTGARINASGAAGGGKVMIGGDWGGGKPTSGLVQNPSAKLESTPIVTASTLHVDGATTINASARDSGNGGKVILWSDSMTTFAGLITARGGQQAGDGGFVEVSSHGVLNFAGTVDTLAPHGTAGTLLLDPLDYYIIADASQPPGNGASWITSTQVHDQLGLGNVVIATNNVPIADGQHGDIFVNSNISWNTNNTLTLSAYRNISIAGGANIDSAVTIKNTASGSIVLRADSTGTGTGTVNFPTPYCDCYSTPGKIDFSQSTGTVSIYYNPTQPISFAGNKYQNPTDFSPRVMQGFDGQLTTYMLVNDAIDLARIGTDGGTLSRTYALGKDIDATQFIGLENGTTFNGVLNGNGGLGTIHSISNLSVPLFPVIGEGLVQNLKLSKVAINMTDVDFVGALAGENYGTIHNVSVVGGTVAGGEFGTGGLVGYNSGSITNSSAAVAVSGLIAGGLVGSSEGTISNSFATGPVSGILAAGGLVSVLDGGSITGSYATSNVSVSGFDGGNDFNAGGIGFAGGLVAFNAGSITNSYATGTVTSATSGATFLGGLASLNAGTIATSFATGKISGGDNTIAGGLVAFNFGSIADSFAMGSVTGGANSSVAGLVGINAGTIATSYSTGVPTGGQDSTIGGLVAVNSFGGEFSGTITGSYWDTQASGRASSDGGTPLTTSQLQAALKSGWDTQAWGIVPGVSYPYLKWQFPNDPPQVVSGIAYSDRGMTPVAGGTTVAGLLNGEVLHSTLTGGPVTTGANGYYYYLLAPGTISPPATQLGVGTWAGGTIAGATYKQNATGSATGLDIYGGYLRGITSAATLSELKAGLGTAIGSHSDVQAIVDALPNRQIDATGASFAIDQPININTLVMLSGGTVTQSAAITANNLALFGTGASYMLFNTGNQIGTLSVSTGSVGVFSAGNLNVGSVSDVLGVSGIHAETVTLGSNAIVTQAAPIVARNLALLGAGGSYTLTNSGNQIGTLAANTGSVTLANFHALDIGAAGGANGVTTTGAFTLNNSGNTITASGPVDVGSIFTLAGGNWMQNTPALPVFSAGDFRITSGSFLRVAGGDGSVGNPYRLADIYGLQGVTGSVDAAALLGKSYVLANDIDAAGTSAWNAGAGFHGGGTFTGVFDGQSHAINGLTIHSSSSPVGLFGFIGTGANVKNLNLANVNITATGDIVGMGALAGMNSGTISHVAVSGTVSGGSHVGVIAGGLVGTNFGTITQSSSAANVSVGDALSGSALNAAGGLVGSNQGTISFSSATGAVSGSAISFVGGLVGQNGLGGGLPGTITSSWASGNVTVTGLGLSAGGLAGVNFAGATITDSQAFGSVSSNANATLANQFVAVAGGLVGTNEGTIKGSSAPAAYATCAVGAAFSCASGAVQVGTLGSAGGLVGENRGTITNAFATANVTGAAGLAEHAHTRLGGLVGVNQGTITDAYASGNVGTPGVAFLQAGGLAGGNSGTILRARASGNVRVGDYSEAGGLVGNNGAVTANCGGCMVGDGQNNDARIADSSASGAVLAGASVAGGLVGDNHGRISNASASGAVSVGMNGIAGGLVGANTGTVASSFATGNINGEPASYLGGLVGLNLGDDTTGAQFGASITGSHASGNVTGTAGSIAGGFFGVNLFGAITQSYATGNVSAGTQSTVGGFGGLNIGSVSVAFAGGAVTGGDNSFVGGFVGVNFAAIDPGVAIPTGTISQAYALGAATGGANSFVAGFAAVNVGSLDQTYAGGLVTGGAGSTTGGLVASNNFNYTLPADIALLDPPGTVTNSYWDRQTTGQTTSAGGTPFDTAQLSGGLPAGFDPNVWGTNGGQYPFLAGLGIFNATPGVPVLPPFQPALEPPATPVAPTTPIVPTIPVTPTTPIVIPTTPIITPTTPTAPTTIPVASQQLVVQDLTRPPPTDTPTLAQVVNTQAIEQQAQQQAQQPQGQPSGATPPSGFGAPPIRLNVGEGRYFYLPPLGETRLVKNEVVLQLPCNVERTALDTATRQLRLNIVNSQCLGSGQAVYRVEITSGQSLAQVIRALAAYRIIVAAQANYLYALAQGETAPAEPAAAGAAKPEGDPDQYVIEKLHLTEAHRLVKGTNVPIAVIDSEIDAAHPDLAGAVVTHYDATNTDDRPHPHGTGMAGAIGSHQRLMGIAPGARLIAIRAFSSKAASAESTTYNILRGLDYALANNVRIVNMSFAGPQDPSLDRALKSAGDKGAILIAAAGNAGPKSPPLYPAANPYVIAVTATDMDNKIFSGANRGKHVAIAAPGVDILVPAPEGTYQLTTGTSVATAHVSGVVALLLEHNPRLTPAEVPRILTQSAKKLGPPNDYGAGLIDPIKALELAAPKSAALPPATPRPAVAANLGAPR